MVERATASRSRSCLATPSADSSPSDTSGATRTAFWAEPTPDTRSVYLSVCGPLYTQSPGNTFEMVEMVRTPELFAHWNAGEHHTMDLRDDLGRARCPVLVLAGEHDPVCPMTGSEEVVASLPAGLVQFERFEHSGHGVFRDEPDRAKAVLRQFIVSSSVAR